MQDSGCGTARHRLRMNTIKRVAAGLCIRSAGTHGERAWSACSSTPRSGRCRCCKTVVACRIANTSSAVLTGPRADLRRPCLGAGERGRSNTLRRCTTGFPLREGNRRYFSISPDRAAARRGVYINMTSGRLLLFARCDSGKKRLGCGSNARETSMPLFLPNRCRDAPGRVTFRTSRDGSPRPKEAVVQLRILLTRRTAAASAGDMPAQPRAGVTRTRANSGVAIFRSMSVMRACMLRSNAALDSSRATSTRPCQLMRYSQCGARVADSR